MPIFESVEIAKYIPDYHSQYGDCTDQASSWDSSGQSGPYPDEASCVNAGFEWDVYVEWNVDKKQKTINLELVSSFEEGIRMFDDPGGSFAQGDSNPNQTLITMSDSPTSILIDEPLSTFRTRMAKLF